MAFRACLCMLTVSVAAGLGPSAKTTHPYWLDDAEYQTHRSTADLPTTAEVVVIGAGGAGISAAYELTTAFNTSVVVVDARGVAGGASGRNSGGVGGGIDWTGTVAQYGEEYAHRLLKDSDDRFQAFIEMNSNADCHKCWIRVGGSSSLYTSPVAFEADAADIKAAKAAGVGENSTIWNATEVAKHSKSSFFSGGTYSKFGGNVWGAKYVFTLTRKALATGLLNLQTQTLVTSVTKADGGWSVTTERGTILAKKVVYATNAYTRDILEEGSWITPVRGQIVMTQKTEKLWDFDVGVDMGDIYMHQQPSGEVLLGGMRHVTKEGQEGTMDDSELNPVVHGALVGLVPSFWPVTQGVPEWRAWSGIMGFSKDFKPLVGEIPNKEGAFIVAGFTGGGVQRGWQFGLAVASMVATGKPPQYWQDLSKYYDQFLASRVKGQF